MRERSRKQLNRSGMVPKFPLLEFCQFFQQFLFQRIHYYVRVGRLLHHLGFRIMPIFYTGKVAPQFLPLRQ